MTDDHRIKGAIYDAEVQMKNSAVAFRPIRKTAEAVIIKGGFPPIGADDEKLEEEVVPLAQILSATDPLQPLREAIYRIEDKVCPPGIPHARVYRVDP